jgi:hypothetical protein
MIFLLTTIANGTSFIDRIGPPVKAGTRSALETKEGPSIAMDGRIEQPCLAPKNIALQIQGCGAEMPKVNKERLKPASMVCAAAEVQSTPRPVH